MTTRAHADAVFHDRAAMSRAVHGLLEQQLVGRSAIHVRAATTAGDEVVPAPPPRAEIGIGAVAGAAIGACVSAALLLGALLWYAASPLQLFTVLLIGAGYGALLGAVAMSLYAPNAPPASAASLYRDFLVRVDVADSATLARVKEALTVRGGALVRAR